MTSPSLFGWNQPMQPPPGMQIIQSGKVQKGDWFRFPAMPVWALCPPGAIGEEIVHALVARPIGGAACSQWEKKETK